MKTTNIILDRLVGNWESINLSYTKAETAIYLVLST